MPTGATAGDSTWNEAELLYSISAGLLQVVNRPLLIIRSRAFKPDVTIEWGRDVI